MNTKFKKHLTAVLVIASLSMVSFAQLIPHFPVNSNLPTAADFEKAAERNKLTDEQYLVILDANKAAQQGNPARASSLLLRLGIATEDLQYVRAALRYAIAADDLMLAFTAVDFWLTMDPQDSDANRSEIALGEIIQVRPNLDDQLRNYVKTSQDQAQAIAKIQRLLSILPDKQLAFDILNKALVDVQQTAAAQEALSQSSERLKSFTDAIGYAQKAIEADPSSDSAQVQYFKLQAPVNFDLASKTASQFISQYPDKADKLRILYARVLIQKRDLDAASEVLESARTYNPNNVDAWFLSGVTAYEDQDFVQAQEMLQRAIDIESALPSQLTIDTYTAVRIPIKNKALVIMSQIAELQGRYKDAITILGQLNPGDLSYSSLLERARLIAKRDGVTEGLKAVRILVPLSDVQRDQQMLAESQILSEAGRFNDAVNVLAKNAGQGSSYDIRYEYALKLLEINRVTDASDILETLIKQSPYDFRAYASLGFTLLDRDIDPAQAETLINKAYQLRPNHPLVLDAKGWLAFNQGKFDDALAYLERGVQLTRMVEVDTHLGEVFWTLGKKDDAIKTWRHAKFDDPANPYLNATLERLGVTL